MQAGEHQKYSVGYTRTRVYFRLENILKATYASKIDILLSKKGLINWYLVLINKMWHLTACKIAGSLSFLNWNDFLSYLWINVGNINSEIR